MSSSTLIFNVFVIVPFSVLLFLLGKRLLSTKSIKKELSQYEKKKSTGFIYDWFYGWKFAFVRNIMKAVVSNKRGDKIVTSFVRLAGGIYLFAGAFFLFTLLAIWLSQ